jgi:tetratricopeptide (TPR) repeat protein
LEHEEYIEKAEEFARKALALDSESAEAHLVLGFTNQAFRGDQRKAFYHLKRALARNPDDPHTLLWLVVGHTLVGKVRQARPLWDRLRRVDPLNPFLSWPAFLDVMEGQLDLPNDYLMAFFRMEPQSPAALFFTAMWLAYSGQFEEARGLVEENLGTDSDNALTRGSLLVKFAVEGDEDRICELVAGDFVRTARRDPQWSYFVAGLHALAGFEKEALDWLSNAVDRGFVNYPFISQHDRLIESIRGEARFQEILTRAKREWEHFDA